jgi:hypothetical protein
LAIYSSGGLQDNGARIRGEIMARLDILKWLGTSLVLSGILLTNLNIYPLNIIIHGTGSLLWTGAGVISKDRALMTNFGLQLPLFGAGFAKVMGWF